MSMVPSSLPASMTQYSRSAKSCPSTLSMVWRRVAACRKVGVTMEKRGTGGCFGWKQTCCTATSLLADSSGAARRDGTRLARRRLGRWLHAPVDAGGWLWEERGVLQNLLSLTSGAGGIGSLFALAITVLQVWMFVDAVRRGEYIWAVFIFIGW